MFSELPTAVASEADVRLEVIWKFECCLIDLRTQVRKSNLDLINAFYFLFNYLTLLSNMKHGQL